MDSHQHNITYVSVLVEDRVEIHYHQVADDRLPSVNLNIFVAAFTTCHARLCLYEALHHMQERVLYFDTDSVMYSHLFIHLAATTWATSRMNWPQTNPLLNFALVGPGITDIGPNRARWC